MTKSQDMAGVPSREHCSPSAQNQTVSTNENDNGVDRLISLYNGPPVKDQAALLAVNEKRVSALEVNLASTD